MKHLTFLLILLGLPLFQEEKQEFITPVFEYRSWFSRLKYDDFKPSEEYVQDVDFTPVMHLSKKWKLFPLLEYRYRESSFRPEEFGDRFRNEYQFFRIAPTLRYYFNKDKNAGIGIFQAQEYSIESANEGWSSGLYDYIQRGIKLDFNSYGISDFKAGLLFIRTEYPNFSGERQIFEGEPDSVIDSDSYFFYVEYLKRTKSFFWKNKLSIIYKNFHDQKVDRTLLGLQQATNTGRNDLSYRYDGDFYKIISRKYKLIGGLKYSILYRNSNQNFYDTNGTAQTSDDVYTEDFYDRRKYSISPYLNWYLTQKVTLKLSYTFARNSYDNRKAQYTNATYKASNFWDSEQTVTLDIRYQHRKYLSFFISLFNEIGKSNNNYNAFSTEQYRVNGGIAGFSLNF